LTKEIPKQQKWPEPSKPPVSPPEERLPASNLPPRLPVNPPQPPEVSRSPTDTDPEPSLFARSVVTKRVPTSSSESFLSNVWSVRSPRISRVIFDSRDLLSSPFKKPPKPTWSDSSKIPTCVLSTPSVLQSCLRISNWPVVSVVSDRKH